MQPVDVESFQETISAVYRTVGGAIGIHVMMLVVERSIWLIRANHPAAALITYDEDGISLDALTEAYPGEAPGVLADLLHALVATLGRMIGGQVAQQLTRDLQLLHQEA